MFRFVAIVVSLLPLAGSPDPASAAKRVALTIGNSGYQHTPRLTNPRNDATDMAAALKKHGFEVIEGFDLDKAAFDRKVRDFANALGGAEAGVFFYAGHGLQVAGQNYLVPIDAELTTATALEFEMVRLDVVHRVMERQTNTNVLFLDACRDNPLARNLARAMGTRSSEIGRGLAAVESGVGTLIGFSTQPGNVALDGTGRNSPFAGALAKHVAASNDDLSAILINVRNDVMKETQRKQVPWEHSALTGRFYFNPSAQTASLALAAELREAAREWGRVDKTSVAELETFIRRHGSSPEAEYARARIEALKQQVGSPPTAPAPPKPAQSAEPTALPQPPALKEPQGLPKAAVLNLAKSLLPVSRSIKDERNQSTALVAVFAAQRKAGFRTEAAATLEEAVRVAKTAAKKENALAFVAQMQARAGDISQAKALALSIKDEFWRLTAIKDVAVEQAIAGQPAEALQLVRSIKEDDSRRAKGLASIAEKQAEAGSTKEAAATFEEALRSARAIKDEFWRNSALADVAAARARTGQVSQAIEIGRIISEDFYRGLALSGVVSFMSSSKTRPRTMSKSQVSQILHFARSIKEAADRADALADVAIVQALAGSLTEAADTIQEAIQTARLINDAERRAWKKESAFGNIAKAQALTGQISEAVQLVQSFTDKSKLFARGIAMFLVQTGQPSQALEFARLVKDEAEHARVLASVALKQAQAGLTREATATLEKAIEVVQNENDDRRRTGALAFIAVKQAAAGLASEAVKTLERAVQASSSVTDERDRSWAIYAVAGALVPDVRPE